MGAQVTVSDAPPSSVQLRAVLEAIRARHTAKLWQTVAKLPREDRAVAVQYATESGYDPRYPELPDTATTLKRLEAQALTLDVRARTRRFSDLPRNVVVSWYQAILDTAALVRAQPPEIQAFIWVTASLWGCSHLHSSSPITTVVRHGTWMVPSYCGEYTGARRSHPGTYLVRMRARGGEAAVWGIVTVYMEWASTEALTSTSPDFYSVWRAAEAEILRNSVHSRRTWDARQRT